MSNFASEKHANLVADVLISADLRGITSHGVFRFPKLVESIELGLQNPKARPEIERETHSCALLNGNHALGPVVAKEAMEIAIRKAKQSGIALVSVKNTNHFGIAAYYTELAAKVDMIGIACCNTEPAMAAFGGKPKILGTNPLSVAIPTRDYPIILDMATTNITRGKLTKSKRLRQDWVLDEKGKPTNKISEAYSLMPLGGLSFGYKGYGLALIIDILSGALSGASCGKAVQGTASLEKCTKGDMFIVINIETFADLNLFKSKVEKVVRDIKEDGCKLPGEIELIKERNTKEIDVEEDLHKQLVKIGKRYGVKL